MTNVNDAPNHFRLYGDVTVGAYFGPICSLRAVNLPGEGHHPHASIHFRGGACIDIDVPTILDLYRRLPDVIKGLPAVLLTAECSGALADLDDES